MPSNNPAGKQHTSPPAPTRRPRWWSLLLVTALWQSSLLFAPAALVTWNSGFANAGVIPDGELTGWSDNRTLSGLPTSIADVNVVLNFSGGWNGDFYVYLAHDSGFSVLLNRVGRTSGDTFGYGDAGLNVWLNDGGTQGDIHAYQNVNNYADLIQSGAVFAPDGRNVSPLAVVGEDARTRMLNQFNGLNPNGEWTLFVADLSFGEQTTLTSWGLEIEPVPEPVAVALPVFAGGFALVQLTRWRRSRASAARTFLPLH